MATAAHRPRRRVNPVSEPEVVVISRPIYRCVLIPDGQAGRVTINGTSYDLLPLGYQPEEGFLLENLTNGNRYDIATDGPVPLCDCGDCTFRQRACKHVLALNHLRSIGTI